MVLTSEKGCSKAEGTTLSSTPSRLGDKGRLKLQDWSLRSDNRKAKAVLPGSLLHKQICASMVRNTSLVLGSRKGLCDLQRSCLLLSFYQKEDIGKVLETNTEKSEYKDHFCD